MKGKIEKLPVSGHIYIWKYIDNERNYPGWNITMDDLANQGVINLLDLMDQCEWSTNKTITTSQPTSREIDVANNRQGHSRWIARPKITFSLVTKKPANHWLTTETSDELEISFGREKLRELREAIVQIPNAKGDYSIADEYDESIVTFWWRLRK